MKKLLPLLFVLASCQSPTEPVVKHEMPKVTVLSVDANIEHPQIATAVFQIVGQDVESMPIDIYSFTNSNISVKSNCIQDESSHGTTAIYFVYANAAESGGQYVRTIHFVNKFSWTADSLVTTAIIYSM